VCCSVLQCVAVCCSVLQCVAVCCSVLQCVVVCHERISNGKCALLYSRHSRESDYKLRFSNEIYMTNIYMYIH